MKIGLVSDTHGHVELARPAVKILREAEVQRVIHCGDIGSLAVVDLFAEWPSWFVFGNTDHDFAALREGIEARGQNCLGHYGELDWSGRRIAVLHGDDWRALRTAVTSQSFDLVCHGHTHEPFCEREGTTLVLNPGALYRAVPLSLAIVDLSALDVDFRTVA